MANTRRYREYDFAHLKLVFEFSIYKLEYGVLPSFGYGVLDLVVVVFGECRHRYAVSSLMDTAYWLSEQHEGSWGSKEDSWYGDHQGLESQYSEGVTIRLSLTDCLVKDCDVERMSKVPYANVIGSLMHLMVCTRPDIAYAVSVVSRYLANSGKNHWEALKWILKYFRGTANVGLVYGTDHGNHIDVTGFVDSDYAKNSDKVRNTKRTRNNTAISKMANTGLNLTVLCGDL
ncbi:hypothetical protein Tco_1315964 [Tanacetum coccineum]